MGGQDSSCNAVCYGVFRLVMSQGWVVWVVIMKDSTLKNAVGDRQWHTPVGVFTVQLTDN